jgi:hypothetical protein
MDSKRLIKSPSKLFRSPIARGIAADESPVERDGGDYGAGCIYGFAVCTRGEALGHDVWIDGTFLQQVTDAINATSRGMKSRFTHPGLSGDGLGKFLGRSKTASLSDGVVRANQHFAKSAHSTPAGDLAGYAMDLADEDPAAFGASIAFSNDEEMEAKFVAQYGGNEFVSPDLDNVKNLPHVRLKELRSVDLVDDPAANPSGMFHRGGNPAAEAEKLAEFCLGFSGVCPESTLLSVSPERAKDFVQRFLSNHSLSIVKGTDMAKNATKSPAEQPEVKPAEVVTEASAEAPKVDADAKAAGGQPGEQPAVIPARDTRMSAEAPVDGKKFLEDFGPQGGVWYAEGKTYKEARKLHIAGLKSQVDALSKENADLKTKLSRGEVEPVTFSTGKSADEKQHADLKQKTGSDGIAKFAASIKLPGQK